MPLPVGLKRGQRKSILGRDEGTHGSIASLWISTHTSFLQKRLSRNQTEFAQSVTNKLVPISNPKFDFPVYEKLLKMRKIMNDHHYFCNASFCIEGVLKHLVEEDMLPAVCFVYRRNSLNTLQKASMSVFYRLIQKFRTR